MKIMEWKVGKPTEDREILFKLFHAPDMRTAWVMVQKTMEIVLAHKLDHDTNISFSPESLMVTLHTESSPGPITDEYRAAAQQIDMALTPTEQT